MGASLASLSTFIVLLKHAFFACPGLISYPLNTEGLLLRNRIFEGCTFQGHYVGTRRSIPPCPSLSFPPGVVDACFLHAMTLLVSARADAPTYVLFSVGAHWSGVGRAQGPVRMALSGHAACILAMRPSSTRMRFIVVMLNSNWISHGARAMRANRTHAAVSWHPVMRVLCMGAALQGGNISLQ